MVKSINNNFIYFSLMIATFLLLMYISLKIYNQNSSIENFKQIDMQKLKGWNRGCVGSIYVPFVRKCPKFLPYEWGPNNNIAHGLCCNNYPKPDGPILDKSVYGCVQGILRSRCTGCRQDEYENKELPNDHPGVCCSKKQKQNKKK